MGRNAAAAIDAGPQVSTREVILDAAERRFAGSGFAGASVREIAADAGLRNQASLYHHFADKQALYEAVLRRGADALVAIWRATPDARRNSDPAPDLDRVLDYLIEHPHLARLIERAGIDEDQLVAGTAPRLLQPLYEQGLRMLEAAPATWPRAELPHLAAGLYHLIFGYFANAALLHAVMKEDPYSPAMLARQRRFLKSAIAQLLGAPLSGRPPASKNKPVAIRRSRQ